MGIVHRIVAAASVLAAVSLAACAPEVESDLAAPPSSPSMRWVGSWAAGTAGRPALSEADDGAPGEQPRPASYSDVSIANQTLRQIVNLSLGGERFRVVLTNAFGTSPLEIGAAHLALRDTGTAIVPESGHELMFGGRSSARIPAGAVLVSDPVPLTAPAFSDLVIDLYLPEDTAASLSPLTILPASWQTNYLSPPGDYTGVTEMPVQAETTYVRRDGAVTSTWFGLARVEVEASESVGAVVTLGDSITNGSLSTLDANRRWPDHLARRLVAAGIDMAVLNAGIGGNRLLSDGGSVSALARFERDVLAQTGVTHVIVMVGINDIGAARANPSPSADDLIGGYQQLIERAHAYGLTVLGGTLTPFEGAGYWTPEGEAKRQTVNEWIRTSGTFDGVIDFDQAVRDPDQPTKFLPRYDPGDHLHPNDQGYEAMANAIDLGLLNAPARAGQ